MSDEHRDISDLKALVRQGIDATETAIARVAETGAAKEDLQRLREEFDKLKEVVEGPEGLVIRTRLLEEGRGQISWKAVGTIFGIILSLVGVYVLFTQIIAAAARNN